MKLRRRGLLKGVLGLPLVAGFGTPHSQELTTTYTPSQTITSLPPVTLGSVPIFSRDALVLIKLEQYKAGT